MEATDIETGNPLMSPLEKLNPVEFVDADGGKRQAFTFQHLESDTPVKVVFYKKEDLPFSRELLESRRGFILGRAPKFRDPAEWEDFVKNVGDIGGRFYDPLNIHGYEFRKSFDSEQAVLFVENNPVNLIDLFFILGGKEEQWGEFRKTIITKGEYPNEVIELIDNLVATAIVDDQGNLRQREDKRENQEAEALVVLGMLGDAQARDLVREKRKVVEEMDRKNIEVLKQRTTKTMNDVLRREPNLKISETWTGYHTTKYKPSITDSGLEIQSTFDATNGRVLRNTIHFSLAGPVANALGGKGWEEMDYLVIGDLAKMRGANGNPRMVSEIDTYFTVSPGKRMVIPDGHLVMPGKLPDGVLREKRGNVTVYKKNHFSPKDIQTLLDNYYQRHDPALDREIQKGVTECFGALFALWKERRPSGKKDFIDYEFGEQVNQFRQSNLQTEEFFQKLIESGIAKGVKDVLQNSQVEYTEIVLYKIISMIEGWFGSVVKNDRFAPYYGHSEGSPVVNEIQLMGLSWGTTAVSHREAHFSDPDGLGSERGPYYIFELVRERKKELLALKSRSNNYDKATLGIMEIIQIDQQSTNINNRKKIMEIVRNRRGRISDDLKVRRMHYLAGII